MSDKLIYPLIVAAILGIAYIWHKKAVSEAVEAARSAVVQEYTREYVESLETQLRASNRLLASAEKDVRELNDRKTTLVKSYEHTIAGLRSRPSRSESKQTVSEHACPTPSNTGASLLREDAEFLAGEASRADTIMLERDLYYKRYNEAKAEIDKLNKEK